MADKLTIKQEKFAQGLFAGLSQREAYKQAYDCGKMTDKSIDELACMLANNIKIVSRLQELTNELKERNMVTVEKILAELAKVGFSNTTDFVRVEDMTYVSGYEKDEEGKPDFTKPIIKQYRGVKVFATDEIEKEKLPAIAEIKETKEGISLKTHDKIKALELMGKHLGMFTDKIESKNVNDNTNFNLDVSTLPQEALDEIAKAQSNEEVLRIVGKYRK